MPLRRLVELDGPYGYPKEIDYVKLKRVANEFKTWLLTVDPDNDPFGFIRHDLPLVEAALNDLLKLPFKGAEPHAWEWHEGLLPAEYKHACAPFYNTIRGAALCLSPEADAPPEVIQKDGKYYAWCEFEDPSQDARR